MKLEAVQAAVQAYQGSVPKAASASGTAKVPSASNVSGIVKAPKTSGAGASAAAKTAKAANTAATQGRKAETAFVQIEAEDGKVVMREIEEPNIAERAIVYEEEPEEDVLEDRGVQQNSKQLQEAVGKLKEKMAANTEAVFGIHEGTNRVMIKIVDKTTKDVIKEYPPEKTLDMIQKVWEMAGIMVDEKL